MSHSSRQLKLKNSTKSRNASSCNQKRGAIIIIMMMMRHLNGVGSPLEAEENANLHLYLCAVDLLSDGLNDANHNVLQAFSLRVVVKNQAVALLCVRAAEGWRPHPRVDGAQVVVQRVEILKSPNNSHKTHISQNSIISPRPL